MYNHFHLSAIFSVSSASTLDTMTVFFNHIFGSNQTPDGYLMYLLVMCGLVVIGLVFVYNWWEERRFNEQVEKSFSPIKNDALLDQNKKQFLEKFSSTTGYLSDVPESGILHNKHSDLATDHPEDHAKSIDDVYSELLDTMSKRTSQKNKVQNDVDISSDTQPISNIAATETHLPAFESAYDAKEEITIAKDPVQHNAIKSIIDQVFKNKGFLGKPIDTISPTIDSSPFETPSAQTQEADYFVNQDLTPQTLPSQSAPSQQPEKTESVLDAFLSAKNAMESQETIEDSEPLVLNDQIKETQEIEWVDDHELPLTTTQEDSNAMAELIGLKVVANAPTIPTVDEIPTVHEIVPQETRTQDLDNASLPKHFNSQIDLIGLLELNTGAALGLLVESFSALYKDFDKPVSLHVQDATSQWVLLNPATAHQLSQPIADHQTIRIACGMQLADRSGAVSRNMINRFQLAFEAIAVNMGGRVAWQNETDAFSQAMALDAFCIDVDKTMFFHLMNEVSGPFTGTKLKGLAEAQGMKLANDGSFKYFDKNDANIAETPYAEFVMFNRDNHPFNPEMLRTSVVKSVTFQLDIPHTKSNTQALDHMLAVAKSLEAGLNAVLVDDNNRPLGGLQIEKIREQIKSIHATMQLRGIVPGSDHAHRLFS